MMTETNFETASLANAFVAALTRQLGPETMEQVRAANDPASPVCLTHQYYDANAVMLEALVEAGFRDDADEPLSDDETELVNAAWDLARANHYRPVF